MKILLLGKNGQLGWDLQRTLVHRCRLISLGREELNLTDFPRIRKVVRKINPDLIINAVAYTSVDRAEREMDIAMAVNGTAPGILAEEADRLGAGLIHYSTDYVFDGMKQSEYVEDDEPNPINTYGKTKLAGEKSIQSVFRNYLILRTSWLFGLKGNSFFRKVYELLRMQGELQMLTDRLGSPTWSGWIADVTATILFDRTQEALKGDKLDIFHLKGGVYHCAADGRTTPYKFALKILETDPWPDEHNNPTIIPVKETEFPEDANRPKNSSLSSGKFSNEFNIEILNWETHLSSCWKMMLSQDKGERFY